MAIRRVPEFRKSALHCAPSLRSPFFPVVRLERSLRQCRGPVLGFLRPGGAQPLPSPKPSVPFLQAAAAATYTLLLAHEARNMYARDCLRDRYWKLRIWVSRVSISRLFPKLICRYRCQGSRPKSADSFEDKYSVFRKRRAFQSGKFELSWRINTLRYNLSIQNRGTLKHVCIECL